MEQWIQDDSTYCKQDKSHSGTYNPVSFSDLNQAIMGYCKPKYTKYLGFWEKQDLQYDGLIYYSIVFYPYLCCFQQFVFIFRPIEKVIVIFTFLSILRYFSSFWEGWATLKIQFKILKKNHMTI